MMPAKQPSILSQTWWHMMLFALVIIPSLRPITKYVDDKFNIQPLLYIFTIIIGIITITYLSKNYLRKVFSTPIPLILMAIGLAAASYFLYPIADGLREIGGGSDADDAIILAVQNLLNGGHPYAAKTYFGNPLSPGPGILFLYTPFIALDVYWLVAPMLFLFTFLLVSKCYGWHVGNTSSIATLSCLLWWELFVVGGDLPIVGMMFLVAALLSFKVRQPRDVLIIALFVGLIASSRIVFAYFPLLLAAAHWNISRRTATTIALVGTATTLSLHTVMAATLDAPYPPLHLLTKGGSIIPKSLIHSGLAACAVVGVWMLYKLYRGHIHSQANRLLFIFMGLITPLSIVALADLATRGWNLAAWEGANYFIPAFVIGVVLCTLKLFKRTV